MINKIKGLLTNNFIHNFSTFTECLEWKKEWKLAEWFCDISSTKVYANFWERYCILYLLKSPRVPHHVCCLVPGRQHKAILHTSDVLFQNKYFKSAATCICYLCAVAFRVYSAAELVQGVLKWKSAFKREARYLENTRSDLLRSPDVVRESSWVAISVQSEGKESNDPYGLSKQNFSLLKQPIC